MTARHIGMSRQWVPWSRGSVRSTETCLMAAIRQSKHTLFRR